MYRRLFSSKITLNYNFCSQKRNQSFNFIYGINPVEAALSANRRKFQYLYMSNSQRVELSTKVMRIMQQAKKMGIPIMFTNRQKMDRIVKNQPHQNMVLKCSTLPVGLWSAQQSTESGIYVFCDKISDPQNFGAILRTSLFFGVKKVFTGKKNHCPLNQTVSKTSSGALELIEMGLVENGQLFMKNWKQKEGSILATGVAQDKHHISLSNVKQILDSEKIQKILVVMGSEGKGVSPHLLKHSDYTVLIDRKGPKQHPYSVVDSLNVSAALSALLFQLSR